MHELLHTWLPPDPQLWVEPGAQLPCPEHADHVDQAPLLPQVRDCVPQFPQACVAGPEHVWESQVPQLHELLHTWLPPDPQLWVEPGAQLFCEKHEDHGVQLPNQQKRYWVPQLPQD